MISLFVRFIVSLSSLPSFSPFHNSIFYFSLLASNIGAPLSPSLIMRPLSNTSIRFRFFFFILDTTFLRIRCRAGLSPGGPQSPSISLFAFGFYSTCAYGTCIALTYIISLAWPRERNAIEPRVIPLCICVFSPGPDHLTAN